MIQVIVYSKGTMKLQPFSTLGSNVDSQLFWSMSKYIGSIKIFNK